MKVSKITKEELLKNGWVKCEEGDNVFLFEKGLDKVNPINSDPKDTGIYLVLHRLFGSPQIAVSFPNGAMLNMFFETMDDLNKFEEQILFYDCEY